MVLNNVYKLNFFMLKYSRGGLMRVLHISDIHTQINNFQTRRLRQMFLKKISELHTEHPYNYIFLSGDISHQGQGFNELSKKIITDILSELNLKSEQLIIVPGNHDLVRNDKRTTLIQEIKENKCPSDFLDEILSIPEKRDILFSSFQDFYTYFNLIKGNPYPTNRAHYLIELQDCNLILINTNIICNTNEEEGSLLIAKSELLDCLEEISNSNKPSIAMGHHTLDCLDPHEKNEVLTLFDDFKISLYLSGHVHSANYKLEADYYNDILMIVCSGMHSDGYTEAGFVDIYINSQSYHITQYIWNSEHKYWTTNNNLGRKMEDGKLVHPLLKPSHEFKLDLQIKSIKEELDDLFDENERIWKQYGPQSLTAKNNPLSNVSKIWRDKCITDIIPNNEKIFDILQKNKEFIPPEKKLVFELYKTHIEGFKNNHLSPYPSQDIPRFPSAIKNIFDN